MFLYMVAELSALQQIMNALTGMNGLPMVIVECAVTTIYTCKLHQQSFLGIMADLRVALGGFKISFITDNIQGAMVIALSKLIPPLISRTKMADAKL
jgi:Na+/proline symporter